MERLGPADTMRTTNDLRLELGVHLLKQHNVCGARQIETAPVYHGVGDQHAHVALFEKVNRLLYFTRERSIWDSLRIEHLLNLFQSVVVVHKHQDVRVLGGEFLFQELDNLVVLESVISATASGFGHDGELTPTQRARLVILLRQALDTRFTKGVHATREDALFVVRIFEAYRTRNVGRPVD